MKGTFDPKLRIIRPLTSQEEGRAKAKELSRTFVKVMDLMKRIPLEELNVHTLAMLYDNTARVPDFIKVFNAKVGALIEQKQANTLKEG